MSAGTHPAKPGALTPWALPLGIIVAWEALSVAGLIPDRVLPASSRQSMSGEQERIEPDRPEVSSEPPGVVRHSVKSGVEVPTQQTHA